jgi:hypothetical protein
MNWRRALIVSGVIVTALLLAFPLRGLVYDLLVLPLAYILWVLKILYQSFDQGIWWLILIIVVLFLLAFSMLPEGKPAQKPIPYKRIERGPVETLAVSLQRVQRGIYFKWLVANRLGRLAHQILIQRAHGKPRSVFAPLTDDDWNAAPEIQRYLEKGLHGSFAEYPNRRFGFYAPPDKTPLDQDVSEVVKFLETKVEIVNPPRGH